MELEYIMALENSIIYQWYRKKPARPFQLQIFFICILLSLSFVLHFCGINIKFPKSTLCSSYRTFQLT